MVTANGFAITIAIPSGSPDGVRVVEKSGWSGTGIDFPRSAFMEIKNQYVELQRPGIYVLWEQDSEYPKVYVGQSESPSKRIYDHTRNADKEFWTRAIVFSGGLNGAHVRYLEASLVELANKAKRCDMDNASAPQKPELGIADEITVEGFLSNMLQCLPVIGVRFFDEPRLPSTMERDLRNISTTDTADVADHSTGQSISRAFREDVLVLKGSNGVDAKGYNGPEFIVLEGSKIAKNERPSILRHLAAQRHRLLQSGVLSEEGDALVFTQDYAFNSPSSAAGVCLGGNANGRDVWKDASGRSLNEIE